MKREERSVVTTLTVALVQIQAQTQYRVEEK